MNNTILIVEHDEETIKSADYIIEVGPKAGKEGGQITFEGTFSDFKKSKSSVTSSYIFGESQIHKVKKIKIDYNNVISINGAKHNNLKSINVNIPLNSISVITGPSGSGKSTFIHEILSPALKKITSNKTNQIIYNRKNFDSISGINGIKQVIELTQNPIGRSPKSNPSTYIGIFDEIRKIFSQTNESKIRGYTPSHFSFNVSKGRCETCEGNGVIKTEMQFLPDVLTTCNICLGSRFKDEINEIKYKGLSISDILSLEISEAMNVFKNHPKISRPLKTMVEIGLGYLTLGQPSTTLSGGEAQRIKLAKEISKKTKGHTVYLLDEPTTGLHFDDISKLLVSFERLRDNNSTVIVIEHNRDIIVNGDYIVDLGPEGGDFGGKVVYQGEPKGLKKTKSLTGKYL
jgi:excinuclease ABC subunit A